MASDNSTQKLMRRAIESQNTVYRNNDSLSFDNLLRSEKDGTVYNFLPYGYSMHYSEKNGWGLTNRLAELRTATTSSMRRKRETAGMGIPRSFFFNPQTIVPNPDIEPMRGKKFHTPILLPNPRQKLPNPSSPELETGLANMPRTTYVAPVVAPTVAPVVASTALTPVPSSREATLFSSVLTPQSATYVRLGAITAAALALPQRLFATVGSYFKRTPASEDITAEFVLPQSNLEVFEEYVAKKNDAKQFRAKVRSHVRTGLAAGLVAAALGFGMFYATKSPGVEHASVATPVAVSAPAPSTPPIMYAAPQPIVSVAPTTYVAPQSTLDTLVQTAPAAPQLTITNAPTLPAAPEPVIANTPVLPSTPSAKVDVTTSKPSYVAPHLGALVVEGYACGENVVYAWSEGSKPIAQKFCEATDYLRIVSAVPKNDAQLYTTLSTHDATRSFVHEHVRRYTDSPQNLRTEFKITGADLADKDALSTTLYARLVHGDEQVRSVAIPLSLSYTLPPVRTPVAAPVSLESLTDVVQQYGNY